MSKRLMTALVLLMVFSMMLAACGATPEPERIVETVVVEKEVVVTQEVEVIKEVEVPAESAELDLTGWKIAALLPGPINDAGWSASAYKGMVMLRDQYGAEIAYTDTVAQADMEAIMREYAKAGFDVVFGHGYEFADALSKVSEEYPDTNFVQINGAIAREPNLYSLGFRTGEGGYFCGLTAGQITESGVVGLIGGTQFPALDLEFANFRKALKDLGRDDIEVLEAYVGSWHDPATAKELATAQIEAGADVLLMVSDAGDAGGIEAAREAFDEGLTNIRVISWTSDKNYMDPDIVMGGWEQSIPNQMRKGMEAIAGGATGAHYAFGMADGVTWWNPFYGLVSPEVEEAVIKARDDYLNGDLEIETNDNI